MTKGLRVAAAAAALALGCRGEQGPVSGELSVRVTTLSTGTRGIQFAVVGPVGAVTAPAGSGYRVFSDAALGAETTHVAVVSPPGAALVAGEVARIGVNDTRRVASYTARLIALAASNYFLLDTSRVSLSIVRP